MGTEQRGIAGAGIHTELGTPLSEVHGAIWAVPDSPHTVILQFHYTWYTLNTTVRCDVEKSRITGGLGRSAMVVSANTQGESRLIIAYSSVIFASSVSNCLCAGVRLMLIPVER